MNRSVVVFAWLVLSLVASAGPRRRSVRTGDGWTIPACTSVAGFPTVALSLDGGRTTLPADEPLEDVQIYTFGLAATNTPNRLLAVTSSLLLVSDDAGCSWRNDGFLFPAKDYRLVRSRDGVWGWSILSPQLFLFGDRTGSNASGPSPRQFTAPVALPIAFSVDAGDPQRLAIADDQGAVFWSDDGAATWQPKGKSPARAPVYSVAFAPDDRAHVVTGGTADGAHVTFDGGATWSRSSGLEGDNVFRIEISPVDANVVWAIALDPQSTSRYRRAIHRSDDGGLTFRAVLRESAEVDMPNGFTMAAAPRNPSLLWFALPGTALYLVDDEGTIRQKSVLPHRDIDAILFSPASPNVLYFGLKVSDMSAGMRAGS